MDRPDVYKRQVHYPRDYGIRHTLCRQQSGHRYPSPRRQPYHAEPGSDASSHCSRHIQDVYKRQPQVRGEFKNATTGVASTAGKFASCFALGAKILKDYYPKFASYFLNSLVDIEEKARNFVEVEKNRGGKQ